jgi:Tfp pilus assembly protein PilF
MTRSTDTLDLLREETAQLRQAQQALRGGQAARAMAMLDEQNRLFARGVLGQERMVTRILALCALGRRGEAQRLGAALERSSPRSPHLATLRNSCARQEPDQRGSTEREVTP